MKHFRYMLRTGILACTLFCGTTLYLSAASPLKLRYNGNFSGILGNYTDVKKDRTFYTCTSGLYNTGNTTFDGRIVVALLSAVGDIKETLCEMKTSLSPGYGYSSFSLFCRPTIDAIQGDRICLLSLADNESSYKEILNADDESRSLPATGHNPQTVTIRHDFDSSKFTVEESNTGTYFNGKPLKNYSYAAYIKKIGSDIDQIVTRANGIPVTTQALSTPGYSYLVLDCLSEDSCTISIRGYRDNELITGLPVHTTAPGTLAEAVAATGINSDVIRGIEVSGFIDTRDFEWMKSQSLLEHLNLSAARITAYHDSQADAIPYAALAYCSNLKSIALPWSATRIENNAFMRSGLTSVIIPASARSIGLNVFNYCRSLKEVHAYNPDPVHINWCVFIGTRRAEDGILHVPAGSREAYAGYAEWKDFSRIVDDLPTGIGRIENQHNPASDSRHTPQYNLKGQHAVAGEKGILIGPDGQKILVR